MRKQRTKAHVKKKQKTKNCKTIPAPLSPLPHPVTNQAPPPPPPTPSHTYTHHLSHPSSICYNNTIDLEFLVQMRQSDKCGSVTDDDIFNLHLVSDAGPWVTIPCLLQDTSHIYWFHSSKQLTRWKQRIQKWDSTPNKLCCTALAYVHRNQG